MKFGNYQRHLKRKYTCNEKYIDTGDEVTCPHCLQIFTRKYSLKRHLEKNRCPKKICENVSQSEDIHKCEYCSKNFKNNRNLKRHIDNYCKTKNVLLSQNTQNNQLHNQSHNTANQSHNTQHINSHNPTTNNTANTNSNNNITQNITINSYGKENLDYIDDNFFKHLLKIPFGGIPKLIRMIHYHPDHPENHNVLLNVSGKQNNLAKTWDGDEWFIKNKSAVIWELMTSSYDKIDEKFDQYRSELNQFKRNNYSNFRKEFENPSKKFLREMKSDIELVLLNYSKKIIEELKKRKLSDKLNPTKATFPVKTAVPATTTVQKDPTPINSQEIKLPSGIPDLSKIPLPFRHYKPIDID